MIRKVHGGDKSRKMLSLSSSLSWETARAINFFFILVSLKSYVGGFKIKTFKS